MTTIFRVFHAKEVLDAHGNVIKIAGRFGFEPTTFPDDFRHVADVAAREMGMVFELTNHIDHNWTENDGVTLARGIDPRRTRSTSVGDIVQSGNDWFVVAGVGFVQLATLDENFQIHVPALP